MSFLRQNRLPGGSETTYVKGWSTPYIGDGYIPLIGNLYNWYIVFGEEPKTKEGSDATNPWKTNENGTWKWTVAKVGPGKPVIRPISPLIGPIIHLPIYFRPFPHIPPFISRSANGAHLVENLVIGPEILFISGQPPKNPLNVGKYTIHGMGKGFPNGGLHWSQRWFLCGFGGLEPLSSTSSSAAAVSFPSSGAWPGPPVDSVGAPAFVGVVYRGWHPTSSTLPWKTIGIRDCFISHYKDSIMNQSGFHGMFALHHCWKGRKQMMGFIPADSNPSWRSPKLSKH